MLEQIILSNELNEKLKDVSNRNEELGCYFLGEKTEEGIKIVDGIAWENELISDAPVNDIPKLYLEKVQAEPDRYILLSGHLHSKRFGEKIRWCDPYWTVKERSENPQFVAVSGADTDDGDVVEALHQQKGLDYALFVHPRFGSVGETMDREKVQVTAYKYDSSNAGKVREIPVICPERNEVE